MLLYFFVLSDGLGASAMLTMAEVLVSNQHLKGTMFMVGDNCDCDVKKLAPGGPFIMNKRPRLSALAARALYAGAFIFLFSTTPAHAYLDPGMGSLILQTVIGGIGGLALVLKIYWHRIKQFFSRMKIWEKTDQIGEEGHDGNSDLQ